MTHGHYLDKPLMPAPEVEGTKLAGLRWLTDKDTAEFFYMRHVIVEEGGSIGLHDHPYEHQIFVINGKGRCVIEGNELILTEGCFGLVPGGVAHSFENVGDGSLEFICCINRVDDD